MKNVSVSRILGIVWDPKRVFLRLGGIAILCALVLWVGGCGKGAAQPGETAAEGRRRHKRTVRINRQQMMEDIDHFMLLDEPSKLTGKTIP